jgi:hypothetical protein
MKNLPHQTPYKISYAPPTQVKDEPHRIYDTLDTESCSMVIESSDYATISIIGDCSEIKTCELAESCS